MRPSTSSYSSLALLLTLLPRTLAAPLFGINLGSGASTSSAPTPLAPAAVDAALQRPAFFARLAYCSPASVSALSCGAQCDVVNTISVVQAGGDGGAVPRCASRYE